MATGLPTAASTSRFMDVAHALHLQVCLRPHSLQGLSLINPPKAHGGKKKKKKLKLDSRWVGLQLVSTVGQSDEQKEVEEFPNLRKPRLLSD